MCAQFNTIDFMIQRVQTIYLVVAAVLLALPMMLRMPLFSLTVPDGAYQLYPASVVFNGVEVMQTIAVLASITIALLLVVYAILQFKNRSFQVNLIKVSILSQLVFLVMVFYYLDKAKEVASAQLLVDAVPTISYSPLLSAPVVAIFLSMLAIRSIKKDEALVRSADRLR